MAVVPRGGGGGGTGTAAGPDGDDLGAESSDAREVSPGWRSVRPRTRLGSRRRQMVAFGVLVAALGVLVFRGLGNATIYFKTADEAVAARSQLGSQRFRIEGIVQPGVAQVGQGVIFAIANNGVSVPVHNTNSPPQLFKPGIPVVLEGHFATDGSFVSDLIMVKHTASYAAKHPDRVSTAPSTP